MNEFDLTDINFLGYIHVQLVGKFQICMLSKVLQRWVLRCRQVAMCMANASNRRHMFYIHCCLLSCTSVFLLYDCAFWLAFSNCSLFSVVVQHLLDILDILLLYRSSDLLVISYQIVWHSYCLAVRSKHVFVMYLCLCGLWISHVRSYGLPLSIIRISARIIYFSPCYI